jgi:hypothetical protein
MQDRRIDGKHCWRVRTALEALGKERREITKVRDVMQEELYQVQQSFLPPTAKDFCPKPVLYFKPAEIFYITPLNICARTFHDFFHDDDNCRYFCCPIVGDFFDKNSCLVAERFFNYLLKKDYHFIVPASIVLV